MQTRLLHRTSDFPSSSSKSTPLSSYSPEPPPFMQQQQQQQQAPLSYASYASTPNSPSFISSSPSFSGSSGYYPSFPRVQSVSSIPFSPSGGDEVFPGYMDAPSSPPSGPMPASPGFPYQQQPNAAPQLMPSLSATAFSSMAMNVPYPSPFSPPRTVFNSAQVSSAARPPAAGAHSARLPMPVSAADSAYGMNFAVLKREPPSEFEQLDDAVMQPVAVSAPAAPSALMGRGLAVDEAEVDSPLSAPYAASSRYGLRAPNDEYGQDYRSASTMSTVSADSSPLPIPVTVSPSHLNPSLLLAPLDSGGGLHRKSSCLLCHRAKTSCDGRRPCDRCIRLDRQHLCVEREKSRGRGKQANKKRKASDAEQRDGTAAAEDKDEDDKEDEADHSSAADESRDSSSPHPADGALPAPSALGSSASAPPPPAPSPPAASSPFASSSPAAPELSSQEELVNVDDRELSSTMLRVLQSDQVSVPSIIQRAASRKNMPAQAMQALISYIGSSLHPDDYRTFMSQLDADHRRADQPADGAGGTAAASAGSSSSISDISDRMFVRLPDGRVMPRVLFTFRRSGFDAMPDSDRQVNIAMLTVYRAPPAAQAAGQKQQQQPSSAAAASAQPAQAMKTEPQETTAATAVRPPGRASSAATADSGTAQHSPHAQQPDDSPASASSPSSAESPASAPVPAWVPDPVPGANFARLSEVDLVVQVNREFERLFNYSQREIRDLMCREGSKALYRLYTPASLLLLGRWLAEACTGMRTEFKAVVTIVNKYRGATAAVLTARFILDPHGFFSSVCYAYTPLPDGLQPKRRDSSDGDG